VTSSARRFSVSTDFRKKSDRQEGRKGEDRAGKMPPRAINKSNPVRYHRVVQYPPCCLLLCRCSQRIRTTQNIRQSTRGLLVLGTLGLGRAGEY